MTSPHDLPEVAPAARGPRRALAVALAVTTVLVLLVVAGAALTGDWSMNPRLTPDGGSVSIPSAPEVSATPDEPDPTNESAERATVTVILVLVGLVLAFLLYRTLLWVRRSLLPWLATQRDRPEPPPPGPEITLDAVPLSALRTAAAHAETLLSEGGRSPDAIIAAWLALEDAAGRSGATRAPSQTPTEFTVAVLTATPASPAAVTELLGLFHLARFARAEMSETQVAAAGAALRTLTDDFTRPTDGTASQDVAPADTVQEPTS